MADPCIEETCLASVTDGTLPDQLRIESRILAAGLRARTGHTTATDGSIDHSMCGIDVYLAGDSADDTVPPTSVPAPLNPDGSVAQSGLIRILLPDGRVQLWAQPPPTPTILRATREGAQTARGGAAESGRTSLTGQAELVHTAGPFRQLVEPSVTVTNFAVGTIYNQVASTSLDVAEIFTMPPVTYEVSRLARITRTGGSVDTVASNDVGAGFGGSFILEPIYLEPSESLSYIVQGHLFYYQAAGAFDYRAGALTLQLRVIDITDNVVG